MDDIDLSGLFEGLFYLIAEIPDLIILAFTTLWGWIIITTLVVSVWVVCIHNENVRRERDEQQKIEQVEAE